MTASRPFADWLSQALVAGCLVGCFNLTLLSSLRFKLPYLFTKDEEVAAIVSQTLPVCAVLQVFDALAAISHGLLRGIGRQGIGGYTNLFSYYLIALPISFSTGWYLGWKLDGLWFGVAVGLAVLVTPFPMLLTELCLTNMAPRVSSVELCYLYHADWEHAVDEAEARMQSDQAHPAEMK